MIDHPEHRAMRRQRRRAVAAVGAGVCALLALSACSGSGSSSGSGSGSAFVVGTVQPLSGAYSGAGQDIVNALKAQAAIINAEGGIDKRQVKIVAVDSASSEQKSVSATQQLVQTQHMDMFEPDVIFGQSDLPLTTGTLSVAICAAPDCGNGQKYPLEFTLNPSAANQVPSVLAYAKQQGLTKIGILATNDAQGTSFTSTVSSDAARSGETVTKAASFSESATDVTSELQTLRGSGANFVAAWAAGTTIDTVMKGMQSLGWNAPVVGTPTVFTSDITTGVPPSVQSQLKCLCYAVGTRTGSSVDPTVAPLVSKIGNKPIASMQVAGLAADTLTLAKYGFTKAGSIDAKKAAAAIQSIASDPNYPAKEFYAYRNTPPKFTSSQHSPAASTLSKGFFAVASVSKVVSGTYLGRSFSY